jgi:hypothetical protein
VNLENGQRKASDILLEFEKKLDVALSIIRTQDLNIKILSNKLNTVLESLDKLSAGPSKITVEAVNTTRSTMPISQFQQLSSLDPEKQIPISSDFKLPQEDSPKGFRRTSRPETFSGDDAYLPQPVNTVAPKFPTQVLKPPPGRSVTDAPVSKIAEVVVPSSKSQNKPASNKQQSRTQTVVQNAVPVMQRVVNGSGKSLFLADVEIIDLSVMQSVSKTRTNGTGKWMASLAIGNYRVIIRKIDPISQSTIETSQDIQVDGSVSPLELDAIIIKS